jgi:uncharacterized membrane protein
MSIDKNLTTEESLKIITEMIQKAKGSHFHENGTSAILWGAVVGFCGIIVFTERYWNYYIGFDVWMLALLALVPQIIIYIKEKKNKFVKTHAEESMGAIWLVYGISIFALLFYFNIVPETTKTILAQNGEILMLKKADGSIHPWQPYVFSSNSLMMIVYAFPTLATGIARKFKPMVYGAIACYLFFIISLYTSSEWDSLLAGLAGIGNWLIPGLILRQRYLKAKQGLHV